MAVTVDQRGYAISKDHIARSIAANGQQSHAVILMKPDGKEYPVDGATATTVAVDPH